MDWRDEIQNNAAKPVRREFFVECRVEVTLDMRVSYFSTVIKQTGVLGIRALGEFWSQGYLPHNVSPLTWRLAPRFP